MLQDRAARRHIVTYAVLVATSLALISFSDSPQLQDLRGGVNFALAPIQETLSGMARSVSDAFTAVAEIDQLRRETRSLQAKVDQQAQQLAYVEVLRAENERLAKLLGIKGILSHKVQPALVVGRQSNQFERVVTLDRGSEAGIIVGAPVLTEGKALVGVVTVASDGFSSVRLLNDTRSLIIGIDVASRATGEVKGQLSRPLAMNNVPATEPLNVGDTVATAGTLRQGVPSLLPRGLLIGTVVDVTSQGVVKTALVQPAANLDELEGVLVITDFVPPVVPGADPLAPDDGSSPIVTPAPKHTPKPTHKPGH